MIIVTFSKLMIYQKNKQIIYIKVVKKMVKIKKINKNKILNYISKNYRVL